MRNQPRLRVFFYLTSDAQTPESSGLESARFRKPRETEERKSRKKEEKIEEERIEEMVLFDEKEDEGGCYITDFVCTKTNGESMVRECTYRKMLSKPLTAKLLEASRQY